MKDRDRHKPIRIELKPGATLQEIEKLVNAKLETLSTELVEKNERVLIELEWIDMRPPKKRY